MLIRSIEAENFMKFSRLCLRGLPARGVLGLEGPNESGKSTIGEAIIFAFFGRSRMTKGCSLESLIRWGADFLRVSVEFSLPVVSADSGSDDERYTIFREVDRFGTNIVKLLRMPGKEEVAAGNIEVAAFVAERIELDLFEFQHAFYHDQYGSRFVDARLREFVERLTGVHQMRSAVESIGAKVEQLEREFSHYQREIKRNIKQIDRHAGSARELPQLRESAEKAGADVDRRSEEADALARAQDEYRKLVSGSTVSEKGLRELAKLRGERLEKGIADLASRYEALDRRSGPDGVVSGELAKEFGRLSRGVSEILVMLRDYEGLRRGVSEVRDSLQSDLSQSDGDTLESRRQAHIRERDAARESVRRAGRGMVWLSLLVLLGVGVGGVAVVSLVRPELLQRYDGLVQESSRVLVAAGGGAVALLMLLLLIVKLVRVSGARSRESVADRLVGEDEKQVTAANQRLEQLDALRVVGESGTVTDYVAAARLVGGPAVNRRLEEFESKHAESAEPKSAGGAKGGGSDDYRDRLRALAEREKRCRKKVDSMIQSQAKKLKNVEGQLRKATSDRDRAENEIRESEVQLVRKEALEEKNGELESAAAEIRARIDDRQAACELLESCVTTMHSKVGPALSGYMHGVLPRLTGDRYRDVKLDADLDMQVFSTDRRDFVAASELSGGTNEALVLGLRLALAQAFIAARTRRPQFVFLDEPFKMMDAPRVLQAIRAMPVLSSDIQQLFVVQPQFTDEQRDALDFVVQTTIETTDLQTDLARI